MNNWTNNNRESFPELFIKSNEKLFPLGRWGLFFQHLGYFLNSLTFNQGQRAIIALAIPTRLFAVSLTAFGYISSRIVNPPEDDCQNHVNYLKSLEIDTPVRIRLSNGRAKKGHYIGYKERGGILYFDIRDVKSRITSIKASESRKIDIAENDVMLTKTQIGRKLTQATPFALDFLGKDYTSRLITESSLDLVFIGPRERIRREITGQPFFSNRNNQGTLQEIIRTAEFQGSINSYRSIALSGRNNAKSIHANIPDPPFVFFDGAQGYLKWRSYWKSSNWLVFLDRTETQFVPAVEQINRDYSQWNKSIVDLSSLQHFIPPGIEAIGFEV